MKPEYKPFVDELIELCIKEDIGEATTRRSRASPKTNTDACACSASRRA